MSEDSFEGGNHTWKTSRRNMVLMLIRFRIQELALRGVDASGVPRMECMNGFIGSNRDCWRFQGDPPC